MKHFFTRFFLPCVAIVSLYACDKTYDTIQVEDDQQIQTYMQQNNLTGFTKDTSGVYYKVSTPGQGTQMQYSDKIPLVITMRTVDGSISATDTIINHYADFLGYLEKYRLPKGIQIGVKEGLKNRGGVIRLIIPSNLAYGRNGGTTYFGQTVKGNESLDVTVRALDVTGLPAYDDISIKKYMAANNLTGFQPTTTGIYYKIGEVGTGSPIAADSLLTFETTGKLLNGTIFQQPNAVSLPLNTLIPAWQELLPLIKGGGTIRMIVPSKQGYGTAGSSTIPAFSCLDFDIKVTDVAVDD
ncbi:hypothetical protein GS399_18410 [Pedobacter sp. HMF7647]|uniref:Peptidyl-prolyl cis-trans isomerase n=1 Tax=Hufsiella arboris TaxID=2695275 RepID=A0A7K1YFQ8_9SPHI|nr:FKBP-type peptidyl-prolyl cis-trans isomerase [Hufsiella arboris]MXV52948.1 hypothetical protein [Hufsiella arboris]